MAASGMRWSTAERQQVGRRGREAPRQLERIHFKRAHSGHVKVVPHWVALKR